MATEDIHIELTYQHLMEAFVKHLDSKVETKAAHMVVAAVALEKQDLEETKLEKVEMVSFLILMVLTDIMRLVAAVEWVVDLPVVEMVAVAEEILAHQMEEMLLVMDVVEEV